MKPLDVQFREIMKRLEPKGYTQMAGITAIEVGAAIKQNTKEGKSFPGQFYDPRYRERTVKDRQALGLQVSKVDFRREQERIEKMTHELDDYCATLRWQPIMVRSNVTNGRLWFYHHHGMGTNPKREIIPITHKAIPKTILVKAKEQLVNAFNRL